MPTYKSIHTGKRVDDAVTKIPESLPTEDGLIVVKANGSASEYISKSSVLGDKLDKQTAQTESDQIYGKLTDGSQTMFDVTMGAEPTTIPRRDTAGRIQVADGVSGNDAVNFNQLSAVESSVSGLNIQNGSGVKSIQQVKNTDGTTIPLKTKNPNAVAQGAPEEVEIGATGESAAVFGGAAAATAKRAFAAGTNTAALGKYSAAFGDNSVSLGNDSFSANYQNTAKGQASAVFGTGNISAGKGSFVAGALSTHSGEYGISFGKNNNGTFNNSILIGNNLTDSADGQIVFGDGRATPNADALISVVTAKKDEVAYIKRDTGDVYLLKDLIVSNDISSDTTSSVTASIKSTINVGINNILRDYSYQYADPQLSGVIGSGNKVVGKNSFAAGNTCYTRWDNQFALGMSLDTGDIKNTAMSMTVVGYFNKPENGDIFQVGNGILPNRSNAFRVLSDGRAKVYGVPKDNEDAVRKLELDTKYDKAGGTIGGNVVITGDLTVNGTQHINNTENLNVENAMIYSNAKGATLATNGGIGIKKNATDVYGIVYDPTSDSVKLGIGKSDANGRFTFNANEGQPVAIRDDSAQLTNNHIIKWDSTNHKLVDSGKSVDDFVNLTDNQTISGIKTFSDAANFKGATSIDGLVTAKAGITTTKIESTTGAGSYDVRSGQFTNGSAENVIKLPQKAGTIALDGDLVTTPITETETVVVDTTTVNFALDAEHDTGMYVSAENAISLGSTQLVWTSGRDKYKVIWDGVEYIVYGQDSIIARLNNKLDDVNMPSGWYSWQLLGNGSNSKLMMYNKDTVDIPFAITQDRWKNNAEWLVYATTSTAATHTIKVIKIEGTYKKVTPEYQYGYVSLFNQNKNQMIICGDHAISGNAGDGIVAGTGNTIIVDADSKGFIGNIIARGDYVNVSSTTGKVEGANIEGSFNALYTSGTIYSPFLAGYMNLLKNNGVDWLSPFVAGYTNSITANKGTIHPDAVFGSNNKLTYDGNTIYGLNLIAGNSHTIKNAALSLITGLKNTVECLTADTYIGSNIVGGQLNTVNHSRVIVGGGGNTSDRNSQFIAGNYSAANEKAIVKIGNGTKDAHANAFEVLDDNRAKVFGTPTENNDVLRYQDTAVEVETSLIGA